MITGATGYVGERLALHLAQAGHHIHALVRSPQKAAALLQHPHIKTFKGDLQDQASILAAMQGCEEVYHLAAYAKVWDKNPRAFYEMNVEATRHVLEAALFLGLRRVVCTSTAGVLGPSIGGKLVTEESRPQEALSTEYERTKAEAEEVAWEYAKKGLEVVVVNPTRVYGPGQFSESNAVTKLIKRYQEGKWKVLPGDGKRIGNYVYIEDVLQGHIAAMEKGKSGERYILGGSNASYQEFFDTIGLCIGRKYKLVPLPLWLMMGFAKIQLFLAEKFGRQPLITPPFIRKYLHDWSLSSEKAIKQLGYQITPLQEGIQKSLDWLQSQKS